MQDVLKITEEWIASLPRNSVALLAGGLPCNDFSRLLLLADRPEFIKKFGKSNRDTASPAAPPGTDFHCD